jgi:sensor histidine kinase YesM
MRKPARFPVPGLLKKRWVYHALFWLMYYISYTVLIIFGAYHIEDPVFYIELIPFFLMDMTLVYFNFYFLIPRLLSTGKYVYYGLSLSLAMLIISCSNLLLKQVYVNLGSKLYAMTAGFNFFNIAATMMQHFYLVGLATGIKLTKDWIWDQQRVKEREKQYLETELNFLKSQIQPHFFFNTLNNLYSLTLKKSDRAPEIVLKLSDLMSYMLYESNTPKVSLSKEIIYLQNYLDLEQLRFGQRLAVSFNVGGETEELSIPPMILILFLENSFKHGVKNNLNKIKIEIALTVEQGILFFQVKNPVPENNIPAVKTGIGLKNVKRRLDLLYGNNYTLDLSEHEKEYIVSLKIPVC